MHGTLPHGRAKAHALAARTRGLGPVDLIAFLSREVFGQRIAAMSSFGADSAVLLHLVSRAAPDLPVLFLETGKHFIETLEYRRALADRLGLTGVVDLKPDVAALRERDRYGRLHETNPDGCCALRKIAPMADALAGFDAVLTGRRRLQTQTRARLPLVESDGRRIKVNPLAGWSDADVEAYLVRHDLPRHPLVEAGYPSIGCAPCTSRVEAGEDARAGRWRGTQKIECGLHGRPAAS